MRAIVVPIHVTYSQLNANGAKRGAGALYNVTTCWWKIDAARAQDARYLFGACGKAIVSAYGIVADVAEWPVMPSRPKNLAGRRAIPAEDLPDDEWRRACQWTVSESRVVRYGEVLIRDGKIHELRL